MSAGGEGHRSLRARLATALLPSFLPPGEREEILSDLEELREHRLGTRGRIRTALWYWWEVLTSALVLRLNRSVLRPPGGGSRPDPGAGRSADFLEGVGRDLRIALRSYVRSPGASFVAVATLALGIGATTAIFSFADALVLRPLPVRDPGRVVRLQHHSLTEPGSFSGFSFPGFQELRELNEGFSQLAAFSSGEIYLGEAEPSEALPAMIVSGNYFSTLGAEMALGRGFTQDEDETPGTHPVVVLSHGLWERRFGGDPSILGRDILVNGHPFTVVGVASARTPTLDLRVVPELWVPLMMYEIILPDFGFVPPRLFGNRGTHWLSLFGRLEAGVSRTAAQSALQGLAAWQAEAYPREDGDWTILLTPASEAKAGTPGRRPLVQAAGFLAAVMGLVLLIACANVANILLARALARSREMGIRLAVGGSRRRLIRQVLTESLLLSLVGGAAGLLLATWAMRLIPLLGLTQEYPGLQVELDPRVLTFALGLSLLTGTAFGIIPAFRATGEGLARLGRGGLSPETGRGGIIRGPRRGWRRMIPGRWVPPRQLLLTVQVAFSLVLLIGAGLALQTLWNLRSIPFGYEIENLHVAAIDLGKVMVPTGGPSRANAADDDTERGYTEEEGRQIYNALTDRIRSLSGVQAAGLARLSPFARQRMAADFLLDGAGSGAEAARINTEMNVVGPGYFQAMEIPVVRGRPFTPEDQAGGPGVVVVNQAAAARFWPGQDPLGQHLRMEWGGEAGPDLEVVGVVADGRYHRSWRSEAGTYLFLPLAQNHADRVSLLVRGRNHGSPSPESMKRIMAEVITGLRTPEVTSLRSLMDRAMGLERTNALVLGLFGLLALLISAMGVYGVVSFSVSQRTHEIGVRMALGARPLEVGHVVITGSALPLLFGVAGGWGAALVLGRFVQSFLYEVPAADPLTFTATAALLTLAGLVAAIVPTRRATRLDPMRTLQE